MLVTSLATSLQTPRQVLDNNPEPSGAVGLISLVSFLEMNLQARHVENLRIIVEGDIDLEKNFFTEEINDSVRIEETD